MASWDAQQYLKFAEERARPRADLTQRISLGSPRLIVDMGCGPGNSTSDIVEWYKGTGPRYYLDAQQPPDREAFITAYRDMITTAYPPQRDGRVLFAFRRLFLIAYR